MVLDGHIHIHGSQPGSQKDLLARMRKAGVDGGILISPHRGESGDYRRRLDRMFNLTRGHPLLFPFFWIDPMEKTAFKQVDEAIRMGVKGFKVICAGYNPYDERPMEVFRKIASRGKPLQFHSGILWDGTPSSNNNRPANWECMLAIPGVRFSLAHISWPWCDEHVAVFGKLQAAGNRGKVRSCEMFIDTTPGTPPIYRLDALTKVFKTGYQVSERVFFGVDSHAPAYGFQYARDWLARDRKILAKLKVDAQTRKNYFSENLKRFVGV